MSIYKIPDEYYFRVHHVRPRFKGDIESLLQELMRLFADIPVICTEK